LHYQYKARRIIWQIRGQEEAANAGADAFAAALMDADAKRTATAGAHAGSVERRGMATLLIDF
jgi:hypothetical protein